VGLAASARNNATASTPTAARAMSASPVLARIPRRPMRTVRPPNLPTAAQARSPNPKKNRCNSPCGVNAPVLLTSHADRATKLTIPNTCVIHMKSLAALLSIQPEEDVQTRTDQGMLRSWSQNPQ